MSKVKKLNDQPGFLSQLVMRSAVVIVIVFAVASIISMQNSIEQKKREKHALQEEIDVITADNEELNDILQSEDISRYMEKLAVENGSYSYAYPDERRYYDTSRD